MWSFGYGNCISCKLQGESYNIESVADDCPYKDKFNKLKKVKRMEQKYIKGDIVMYDNKIHTIMDTLELNNYELSYIEHPVHQLELSGVPLTLEILEKNGWKDDGYDWYRLPTKRAYLYITKDITTLGEFLVCVGLDRHNLASINFVHQLQHLLFGLNINSEMEV